MTSHQLTPDQTLSQHYQNARNEKPDTSNNPVSQKELYARLQNMGRVTNRTQSLASLVSPHGRVQVDQNITDSVACFPQSKCWQSAQPRDEEFEGLGLSEL